MFDIASSHPPELNTNKNLILNKKQTFTNKFAMTLSSKAYLVYSDHLMYQGWKPLIS